MMQASLILPFKILATIVVALIIIQLWRRAVRRMEARGWLPPTVSLLGKRLGRWIIIVVAALTIMDFSGLPIRSVWAGLLSILVMVAIAFFASWSILSNILSSLLLLTFSRLRIGDTVELRDTKRDEVGLAGRIVDINAFFVILQEINDSNLPGVRPAQVQVPCHLFFFRAVRRWPGESTLPLIDAFDEPSVAEKDQPRTRQDS